MGDTGGAEPLGTSCPRVSSTHLVGEGGVTPGTQQHPLPQEAAPSHPPQPPQPKMWELWGPGGCGVGPLAKWHWLRGALGTWVGGAMGLGHPGDTGTGLGHSVWALGTLGQGWGTQGGHWGHWDGARALIVGTGDTGMGLGHQGRGHWDGDGAPGVSTGDTGTGLGHQGGYWDGAGAPRVGIGDRVGSGSPEGVLASPSPGRGRWPRCRGVGCGLGPGSRSGTGRSCAGGHRAPGVGVVAPRGLCSLSPHPEHPSPGATPMCLMTLCHPQHHPLLPTSPMPPLHTPVPLCQPQCHPHSPCAPAATPLAPTSSPQPPLPHSHPCPTATSVTPTAPCVPCALSHCQWGKGGASPRGGRGAPRLGADGGLPHGGEQAGGCPMVPRARGRGRRCPSRWTACLDCSPPAPWGDTPWGWWGARARPPLAPVGQGTGTGLVPAP